MRFYLNLSAALWLSALRLSAQAGESADRPQPQTSETTPATSENSDGATAVTAGFMRHLNLNTFQILGRFTNNEDSNNVVTFSKLQWGLDAKGDFKFDDAGNYLVHTRVTSGTVLTGGFNDTGLGLNSHARSNLYVKRLYFQARPLSGVEFQFGSLPFFRGQATSVTHYDEGGFIVGERVTLRRPEQVYFDEIVYTIGFLGASFTPNVLSRFPKITQVNYHQYLVTKRLGKRVEGSLEYSSQLQESIVRQAFKLHVPELKVFDSVTAEAYQRLRLVPGNGFGLVGQKALSRRLTTGIGWASIDEGYVGLNDQKYNKGRRFYATAHYRFSQDWALDVFATRGVRNDYFISNKRRIDVVVSYDALSGIKRFIRRSV